MSRTLTGAMALELDEKQLAPVFFFEADFAGGFARMWNGIGSIIWDTKTWLGGGQLIGMTQMEETREIDVTSLSVSLAGVEPVLVATAYGDFSQGRPLKVWLGLMRIATAEVITDPVAIFQGRMDTISDTDDGVEAVITVMAQSNLSDPNRIRSRTYTDQDQQRLFPGDRSFRFVPSLQDKNIYWGVREGSPQLPSVTT